MNVTVKDGTPLEIKVDGTPKPHLLRVLCAQKPASVQRDGTALTEGQDWEYKADKQRLIVRCKNAFTGKYTVAF
jgi:hypothetical protein